MSLPPAARGAASEREAGAGEDTRRDHSSTMREALTPQMPGMMGNEESVLVRQCMHLQNAQHSSCRCLLALGSPS